MMLAKIRKKKTKSDTSIGKRGKKQSSSRLTALTTTNSVSTKHWRGKTEKATSFGNQLPVFLFRAYAHLTNEELNFLLKHGNIGCVLNGCL